MFTGAYDLSISLNKNKLDFETYDSIMYRSGSSNGVISYEEFSTLINPNCKRQASYGSFTNLRIRAVNSLKIHKKNICQGLFCEYNIVNQNISGFIRNERKIRKALEDSSKNIMNTWEEHHKVPTSLMSKIEKNMSKVEMILINNNISNQNIPDLDINQLKCSNLEEVIDSLVLNEDFTVKDISTNCIVCSKCFQIVNFLQTIFDKQLEKLYPEINKNNLFDITDAMYKYTNRSKEAPAMFGFSDIDTNRLESNEDYENDISFDNEGTYT